MEEYDRSIRMYDEGEIPEVLDKALREKKVNTRKFLSFAHAESYMLQMRTIAGLNDVRSVFELGPGEHYCARNMERVGYRYVTFDFDDSHNPTIVGDWNAFDVSSLRSTYDITCAFQVLEHFPWENFGRHITRLAQLSRKYVFVSLPYSCTGHTVTRTIHRSQCDTTVEVVAEYVPTNLPQRRYRAEFIKEFPWAVHHWEIGRQGTSLADVLAVISDCGLSVLKQFHSPNPYHYFILAAKR